MKKGFRKSMFSQISILFKNLYILTSFFVYFAFRHSAFEAQNIFDHYELEIKVQIKFNNLSSVPQRRNFVEKVNF